MSHNANSVPVRFKLRFPGVCDIQLESAEGIRPGAEQLEEEVFCLPKDVGTEGLRKLDWIIRQFRTEEKKQESQLGWSVVKGGIEEEHGKKYDCIIAHKLVKGKNVVWYVDESQYDNVGYSTPSFIAFDQASIEALQKDVGGKIEKDTTVQNWW